MNSRVFTKDEARKRIMAYCAMQERCHYDVKTKLDSWQIPYSIQQDIVAYLIEYNFLNEERFARSFARGKFNLKQWGRQKIIQKLIEKRVSKPCIKLGLEEISKKEYNSTILKLIKKKEKDIIAENKFEKMTKIKNYLLQKGFQWSEFQEQITGYD